MKKEVSNESDVVRYTESRKSGLHFIHGILYSFGLDKNPILCFLDEYKTKSDADRLAGDWYKVGEDIRKAYGKETKNTR
jgi:hypothetical protein